MGWRNDIEEQRLHRQRVDENPPRCQFCSRLIPKPRRYHPAVKYCSEAHKTAAGNERYKQRADLARAGGGHKEAPDFLYDEDKVRRDNIYRDAMLNLTEREMSDWLERRISDVAMSRKLGYTPQAVGRARMALWNDRVTELAAEGFDMAERHRVMLGRTDEMMRHLYATDRDAYEAALDEMVDAFVTFREEFFPDYITETFHRGWIRLTLDTIYRGGRQLILSPPRHGKTDLLIHFCVWLIIRDPNIRILWVGPNGEIAENALGQVAATLADHEALRAAFLPENVYWEPQGKTRSRMWQTGKFRVANRTMARKQPTMWAAGVGGKILSLDADFIIVDDPADPDDSAQPSGREAVRRWFRIKLVSRKMAQTGLAVISSRVHIYDLYNDLLENPRWSVHVDRAHDTAICMRDLFDPHDDEDCVLFPALNPLDYLQDQHEDVGAELFDMMYLNQPRPSGTLIFDPDIIAERCFDWSRDLGLAGLPQAYRLVAGIDPAARNTQAGFLWAIDLAGDADYMVDLDETRAGGIGGAVDLIRDWHERYGCRYFVIEDVGYQKVFWDDPRVKEMRASLDIEVRGCSTGANKHDPLFGVSAMAIRFHEGKVSLPYGTRAAQAKTDRYVTQLVSFTGEGHRERANKGDIRMAAWVPMPDMVRSWRRAARQTRVVVTDERSFVGYRVGNLTEEPWAATRYPI